MQSIDPKGSFAKNLILSLVLIGVTSLLIPLVLKQIDDRKAVDQQRYQDELSRQDTILDAQANLIDTMAADFWEYELYASDVVISRDPRYGDAAWHQHHIGRLQQAGVLRAIDEAGEVPEALVRPPGKLIGQGGNLRERLNRLPGFIEEDVVLAAGQPQHGVMLGSWHREASGANDGVIEAGYVSRNVTGCDGAPQFRAEAGDQVHTTDGRAWLPNAGQGTHQIGRGNAWPQVELQVDMARCAQRENPALSGDHRPSLPLFVV